MEISHLIMVFVAVAAGTYGLTELFAGERTVQERLNRLTREAKRNARVERWNKTARLVSPAARLSAASKEQVKDLKSRMINAGYRSEGAITVLLAAKVMLAIALPLLALTSTWLLAANLDGAQTVGMVLLLGLLGFYLPNIWLGRAVAKRQREVFESFPEAVDMMVVCVEAGLGLDAALARTASEMQLRSPELAEELELVGLEMRVGATRERALRGLARRTGLAEVSSFVAMMLQADKLGTSVGDSLRVQSDALRVKRRQRAEETAAKLPVKMLFPLVLCIFPSMLLVLVGPSVIQMIRILFPAMAGGG